MKNQTSFKKGHKMLPGSEKGWIKKGQRLSPKTEFKKGSVPVNWKGDMASYTAKHIWIANKRGKPHFCEHCKRSDLPHRHYQWANVSHEYKRELSDWIRLCAKCHANFDKKK